ncbi:MAG: Gx transporter family protein [Termitinemataceae bacterium]|nr:MAG: Gx transporter family protein [Termitinemataceae bacterium]
MQNSGDSTAESQKVLSLLAAFCLFLSALEYLIPKPLPFMRIGLANLPILLALDFKFVFFAQLVLVKIIGQAILGGTLFSYIFLFSLSGSISSALLMFVMRHIFSKRLISFAGIGIAGAFASSIAQLILSYFLILGPLTIYIAPVIMTSSVITGAAIGIFCNVFCMKSMWYKKISGLVLIPAQNHFSTTECKKQNSIAVIALFIAGIIFSVCLLASKSLSVKISFFIVFWIAAALRKKAGNPIFTIVFFLSIALINLYPPSGKVLFEFLGFRITSGALNNALQKAATIEALLMISKTTISRSLELPFNFGILLKDAFCILDEIRLYKKTIRAKTFMCDIDNLMMRLSAEPILQEERQAEQEEQEAGAEEHV